VKPLRVVFPALILFFALPYHNTSLAAGEPDLAELAEPTFQVKPATPLASASVLFNELNSRIRDGKVGRDSARIELIRLLAEIRTEYYRAGGSDHPKESWVFPLAGHDSRAIGSGRNHGYIAGGYDYFSGNRHGGHPAFDIFIHDRNQDGRDDRSGRPVKVLSLTGGIVVALERDWHTGSDLRGGRYIWVYDPANDLLVYYAHNSKLFVELGEVVKPGDHLADVGRSGYNAAKPRSPSHLHLSVLKVVDGRPLPLNVYQELARARKSGIGDQLPGTGEQGAGRQISGRAIAWSELHVTRSTNMAKPNFQFLKRQKELEKIKKQEEKRQRKLEKTSEREDGGEEPAAEEENPV